MVAARAAAGTSADAPSGSAVAAPALFPVVSVVAVTGLLFLVSAVAAPGLLSPSACCTRAVTVKGSRDCLRRLVGRRGIGSWSDIAMRAAFYATAVESLPVARSIVLRSSRGTLAADDSGKRRRRMWRQVCVDLVKVASVARSLGENALRITWLPTYLACTALPFPCVDLRGGDLASASVTFLYAI